MGFLKVFMAALLVAGLAACSHRSGASVERSGEVGHRGARAASQIIVTAEDITDRKYRTLGDITASASKVTIFNSDPTEEMINEELRVEAAKLGADAVVLVRYGTVGLSAFSWGTLEGKGRAIAFED